MNTVIFSYHQWIMLQYPYIVDEYVKFVPTTIFDVVQLSSILYKEISHLPSGHIQITDVIIIAHIVKRIITTISLILFWY